MRKVLSFLAMLLTDVFATYGVLRFMKWTELQFPKWIHFLIGIVVVGAFAWHYFSDLKHFNE